ncbi:methyltransferase domain-containing protein [Paraburkholderia caledonica]|uniref:class I SAM-dependent methyltransferase n=1 Tax=Paraburkholderia caledonica TaxID=134536 RepID=UPI0038B892A5
MTPDRSNNEHILANNRIFPMAPVKTGRLDVPESGLSGVCPVCGVEAKFLDFTDNERESGVCSNCGSFNRQRQIASIIRNVFGMDESGPFEFADGVSIYNTESTGAVHNALRQSARYTNSEYFGDGIKGGEIVDGIRHEDLQNLSFDDASFDLIVSSDVLEHMPRPYDAHAEIFRVLKPGGRHVFTVPFYPWDALDQVRAVQRNGEIEYFGDKWYHGDPVRPGEGVLVWTVFGLQMIVELARIGFVASYWNLDDPSKGIIGPWSIVFDARKPG